MIRRTAVILCLLAPIALQGQQPPAHGPMNPATPRAIRRDVPLTNAIRRAYEAGTRDGSGRPGPNYWQLQTDYTISVRLDPATQTLTGTETIALHNNSPQALNEIVLRLDHNIFRGLVPRGTSVPAENTDGMVVTQMAVNGEAVDLNPPAPGAAVAAAADAAARGGDAPRRLAASGMDQTVARISLVDADPREGDRHAGDRRGTPSCPAAPTAAATA